MVSSVPPPTISASSTPHTSISRELPGHSPLLASRSPLLRDHLLATRLQQVVDQLRLARALASHDDLLRRALVKAQWKGVNEKVGKMMADALFPELKKKRAAKKVVVAGKSARKAKLVNDLLKSRGKKVVAKKRAPRRK
jgi:hypothetical protein